MSLVPTPLELSVNHLFSYLDVDTLIVLYFVNSNIRTMLDTKEALYQIHHALYKVPSTNIPTSLWNIVRVYDGKTQCCRSTTSNQLLLDIVTRALAKGDHNTAIFYSDYCHCATYVRLAISKGLTTIMDLINSVTFTTNIVRNTIQLGSNSLELVRILDQLAYISYRETIFLLRYSDINPVLILATRGPSNVDTLAEVLVSLFLCQDGDSIIGIVNSLKLCPKAMLYIASQHGYCTILFMATLLAIDEDCLVAMLALYCEQQSWDTCIDWARCYEQLFPNSAHMRHVVECVTTNCAKAKLSTDPSQNSALGNTVARILRK